MNVENIISITMILLLLSLLAVIREGRKGILRKTADPIDPPEADWPEAALIIPVTGYHPEAITCLASLAAQDYPNYKLTLVTESAHDAAIPAIRQLMAEYSHVRHVISGSAVTCGQKNHNLLAGVKSLDHEPEVLIFFRRHPPGPERFSETTDLAPGPGAWPWFPAAIIKPYRATTGSPPWA